MWRNETGDESTFVWEKIAGPIGLLGRQALSLQKSEGFRAKATGGDVVVCYYEPPATKDLKFSGFPDLSGEAGSED
jgi:hypothetical protein